MKKPMSLRLRLTLLCAALLTLCCLLLTLTSNLSAVQMADAMQAVPVLPAQAAGTASDAGLPMTPLEVSNTVRQGGRWPRWTGSPDRSGGARRRIWSGPWPSRTAGTRWPSWPAPSTRCRGG